MEETTVLDPAPDQIDLATGKKMWMLDGYRIWADSYQQALEILPLIQKA